MLTYLRIDTLLLSFLLGNKFTRNEISYYKLFLFIPQQYLFDA
jgi:hypothetical protein